MATYRVRLKRPVWDDFTPETLLDDITNEPITAFSVLKSVAGTDMYVFNIHNPAWTFLDTMNRLKGLLGANVPPIGNMSIIGYYSLTSSYQIDLSYPGQEGISLDAPCYLVFEYNNTPVALALWVNFCD